MIKRIEKQESLAVVGGGVIGIAAAIGLAKCGKFKVTIIEKEKHLGGLSSYYRWQDILCDRFYHVILSDDTNLISLIKDLDIESKLFWRESKSGFYGEGKLVPFSSAKDFTIFPFLSLWQKFRLGLGILYTAHIRDSSKLCGISVEKWLIKIFGKGVYAKFWEPLLRSKLGEAKNRTSASFIWATIKRLYGAQSLSGKREKMGHVLGGYYTILKAAGKRLDELGVKIIENSPVVKISYKNKFDLKNKSENINSTHSNPLNHEVLLETDSRRFVFNKVLFTGPCSEFLKVLNYNDESNLYWQRLREVEYLGVVCVLIILKRKLSPYYVINLLDKELPFTGIIESTNVIIMQDRGDRHLVYLPKYVAEDDPISHLDDDKVIKKFVDNLKRIFPECKEGDILHSKVFREKYVQPIQKLDCLNRYIGFKTPISGLYLANNSMIHYSTLHNNAVLQVARDVVQSIKNDVKEYGKSQVE